MTSSEAGFRSIAAEQIAACFESESRQYLVGLLSRPQLLEAICDPGVEIGITRYASETVEAPHWHPVQREYQLMFAGSTDYLEVQTGRRHTYRTGDFYAIMPGVCYEQRSEAGTKILFVKVPSVSDKTICRRCERQGCPARREPFAAEA